MFNHDVGSRLGAIIACRMSEMLKAVGERRMTVFNGLHIQNAARSVTLANE
jgi:hypothetical protein